VTSKCIFEFRVESGALAATGVPRCFPGDQVLLGDHEFAVRLEAHGIGQIMNPTAATREARADLRLGVRERNAGNPAGAGRTAA
jgi:hypothetical protein